MQGPPFTAPEASGAAAQGQRLDAYRLLPLIFEPNAGQTDPAVKFLSRGSGYALFLTPDEAVLALTKAPGAATVVRTKVVGARQPALMAGLEPLPGKVNYFIGNDPTRWLREIPTYAKVEYRSVYPGVDLVYYGSQRTLEYDFIVSPGADPKAITLAFEGSEAPEVDARGDLVLKTAGGQVRLRKPLVYQEVDGHRKPIAGDYVLKAENQIGFQVAAYDAKKPLVIDPVLSYSTYLGGSGVDQAFGIAVDASGNAYVTGATQSANFPVAPKPGAFDTKIGGNTDAFVTKLNSSGGLVYSTYLGGGSPDSGAGIAVDCSGNAYVTGQTQSANFPVTAGAFEGVNGGSTDAFLTVLNAAGSALLYSSFLGGKNMDAGLGVAVVPASAPGCSPVPFASTNIYVTGFTTSADFPTTTGAFSRTLGGGEDAFVAKVNPAGKGPADLVYSSLLGGSGDDVGNGIAADVSGNAYVTGTTSSATNITTQPPGAFGSSLGGTSDAFVTKVNTTVSGAASRVYSVYLGGSCAEQGRAIAVDGSGRAYVTGQTFSTDFPGAATFGFQPTLGEPGNPCGASGDAFVATLKADGTGLLFSTYLGGGGADQGFGIAVDGSGNAYVAGITSSSNFPVTPATAMDITLSGPSDAFVTRINTGVVTPPASLGYSTYLGGSAADQANALALDSAGNIYVAGQTSSTDLLTLDPPATLGFQTALGGGTDAFVAKIGGLGKTADLSIAKSASTNLVAVGGALTYTLSATNGGPDSATGVVVTDTLPSGVGFVSATPSQGTCSGSTVITCGLGVLSSSQAATVTVKVTAPAAAGQIANKASVTANEFDPNTANNTASVTTTVSVPTATSLVLNSVSPSTVTVGSAGPVSFQATLTANGAGLAGATVTFTVDGVAVASIITNASGVATFNSYNPSALAPGNHNVRATFAGQTVSGTIYAASASNTLTLTVTVPTTLVLNSVNPSTVTVGSAGQVSFQATLTGNGAGVSGATVTFTVDGVSVASAITNASGVATFSAYNPSALAPGSHNVEATFAGQTIAGITYTASPPSNTLTLNVTVPTTLALNVSPSTVALGSSGPVSLQATLTGNGAGVSGATVTFTVDGVAAGSATTDASGNASLAYNPSALGLGSHTVQASFGGQTIAGITFLTSSSPAQTLKVITAPTLATFSPNILLQFQTADVTVTGTEFLPNAGMSFGPGTQVNSVTVVNATTAVANVTALPSAFPADPGTPPFSLTDAVTLTNSDGGTTTRAGAFTVVRDSDGDGVADNFNFGAAGTFDFGSISTNLVPSAFRTGNVADNCPVTANQSQRDTDGDGIGDLCDRCPNQNPNPPDGVACDNAPQIQATIVTSPIPPLGDFYGRVDVTFPVGNYLFFPAAPGTVFFSVLDASTNPPTELHARYVEFHPILIPDNVEQSSATSSITTTAIINVGALYPDGLPAGAQLQLQTYYDSHVQAEDPSQLQIFCPATNPTCTPPPLLMARTATVTTPFTVQNFGTPIALATALVIPSTWELTWAQGATGVVDVYIGNVQGFDVTSIPPSTVLLNGLASPTSAAIVAPTSNPILAGFTGNVLHLQFSEADAARSVTALFGQLPTNSQVAIQLTGKITSDGTTAGTVLALLRASSTVTVRNDTEAILLIDNLINLVESMPISPSTQQAFLSKLNAALTFVINGDIPDACSKIQDFINLVNAQTGKGVTVDQANQLIAAAQQIQAVLGCS